MDKTDEWTVSSETPFLDRRGDSEGPCQMDQFEIESGQDPGEIVISPLTTSYKEEILYVLKSSMPVLLTFILQFCLQSLIPMYYAGVQGKDVFAACSLSIALFYISGPVIVNGFSTALDTLCATAYGAGSYSKVGVYYQRCTTILLFMFVPISLFWLFPGPFVNSVSEDPQIVEMCSSFLSQMVMVAPPLVIFECTKRYLQAQAKFIVATTVMALALPLSVILCHFFTEKYGYLGPAYSLISTYWIIALFIVFYLYRFDDHQCWNYHITAKVIFQGWGQFAALGFPGIMMVFAESFAHRIITFLSAKFGTVELASQTIVTTVSAFSWQIPFAMGICSSVRLAYYIGARSENYKIVLKVAFGTSCIISVLNSLFTVCSRNWLPLIFTRDQELIDYSSKLFLIVSFNQIGDAINAIFSALLRGQGKQRAGSLMNFIAYYVVAVPLEVLLGFYFNLGVTGLWIGMLIGVFVLSSMEVYLVASTDWHDVMVRSSAFI
ncbi:hypothetical protein OGAPHI_003185 [Ogataea philodendri]|uniref:Uncharacterized protein n=1 Tax=Ogataea philodendri TaxID=1378263 RepID=A0A9P8T5F4_9ASCO|nr:uncharacterized protein OGAPHI_003185 [Ogataea philodendri]KAH3666736.1 hypothetical protein OGAPHI_003185 [Ogataea philodendri]